jgi:uridine kinase
MNGQPGSITAAAPASVGAAAGVRGAESSEDRRLGDVAALSKATVLDALGAEDIGALLEHLDIVSLGPGATITATALCFVLEGRARLERAQDLLAELGPHEHFGELSLVGEAALDDKIVAVTPVRIARLTRESFEALERARPAIALHLVKALLAHVGALARRGSRQAAAPRVADVLPARVDGALVVGGSYEHRAIALGAPAPAGSGAGVTPVTTRSWEGKDIYRRTAGLVLLEAARRIGRSLRLGPSITSGRVVVVEDEPDLAALSLELARALADIVLSDVPVREEVWAIDEAIARLGAEGSDDAAALLATWPEATVPLVTCGELHALSPGPMLPRTGMLSGIEVLPHPLGLMLDFGPAIRDELTRRPFSTRAMELSAPRYGAEMTRHERRWLELLGATSVGRFNQACVSGQVKELINVAEGFHEKRIALIADQVKSRGGTRIVAVAGPSSSGKTTFIKRLKVQLQVNGIHPVELSLDDYYCDRELSPRDARGEYDYEALESIDLALLDQHTSRLLAGDRVRTARYDFLTGKSLRDGGPELQVGPSDVLLVEGIHALNPALLGEAAAERSFRIFIHPATSLPFDRLSSLEPADVRLVRRIVRDRHQRGTAAADNLARWQSVRRGERLHIFPFQPNADAVFDSSLVYEASVLKVYAERYLLEVPRAHAGFSAAQRLRRLLAPFVPIHPDHVPPTSILREFIGGSGFSY